MESELLRLAISQGIWCALFVFLFFWTLNKSNRREDKLQEIIQTLTEDIKEKLNEIDVKLKGK